MRTFVLLAVVVVSCKSSGPDSQPSTASTTAAVTSGAATAPLARSTAAVHATIGTPAPDFALKDLDGKEYRLSSYAGKTVVLEWFNPSCPFVKKSHTSGSLRDAAAKRVKDGVIWLAINSSGQGREGSGVEANRARAKEFSMGHPILLDESGDVGRMYGATNTPHIMIVDSTGKLVYRGAIDNSPDGEGESPTGGKLVSYVDATLADLAAGRPVATAETKAYGCGVKYPK